MKKLILVPLLLIAITGYAVNQDSVSAISYYRKAIDHYKQNQRDKALLLLDSMKQKSVPAGLFNVNIKAYLFESKIYAELRNFEQAISSSDHLLKEAQQNLQVEDPIFLNIYSNLTAIYAIKNDDENRDFYLGKSKSWIESYGDSGKFFDTHINLLNNIGVITLDKGDFYGAIAHLEQVLELLADSVSNNSHYIKVASKAYESKGNALTGLKKFDKAIESFEESMTILEKEEFKNHQTINRIKRRMAFAYKENGNAKKAIALCEQVLANQDFYKSAQQKEYDEGMIYHILGQCYTLTHDYVRAEEILSKAISHRKKFYLTYQRLKKHSEIGKTIYRLSELYKSAGKDQQSLETLQDALIQYCISFNNPDTDSNPKLEDLKISAYYLASILRSKAETQTKIAQNNNSLEGLESAFETYKLLHQLIDRDRQRYMAEQSKLFLLSEAKPAYENSIDLAYQIFAKTQDDKYPRQIFEISEKSKAVLLFSALKDSEAKFTALIPDSLLKKERRLQKEWYAIKERIYKSSNQAQPNDSVISALKKQAFTLKQKIDDFTEKLEIDYPQYYELKNDAKGIKLAALQKALRKEDQQLIEFFVGEKNVYIIHVLPHTIKLHRTAFEPSLKNVLKEILDELQGLSPLEFSEFALKSHAIYNKLLAPLDLNKGPRNLLIVPDGVIGFLPFEILISEKQGNRYLIQDHPIGYAYSAKMRFNNPEKRKRATETKKELLAYAPDYTADDYLAFNKDEVQRIHAIMPGLIRLGLAATEHDFQNLSADYSILHLAVHAELDADDPMFSYLSFAEDSSQISDTRLYAHQVFTQNLFADLVVLSACQTGYGPLEEGEGIMSLARAFRYAGCAGILMNLWKSDGSVSQDLMANFYARLKEGMSKDQALQQAKLDYLETALPNRKAPRYWANFVLIGDPSPLTQSRVKTWLILALLFLSSGLVLFILKKKNKS